MKHQQSLPAQDEFSEPGLFLVRDFRDKIIQGQNVEPAAKVISQRSRMRIRYRRERVAVEQRIERNVVRVTAAHNENADRHRRAAPDRSREREHRTDSQAARSRTAREQCSVLFV